MEGGRATSAASGARASVLTTKNDDATRHSALGTRLGLHDASSTPALGGHGRQWHLPSLSNQAYFLSGAHVMINRPYNMAGGLPAIPAVNLDTQLAMQQDAPNLQPPGFFGSLLAVPQRFAPNVGASPEAAGMNLQQQQLLQATLGGMPTVERDRYSAAETLSLLGSAGFMCETGRQQHKRALAPDAASAQASSSKQKRQRGTLASTLLIKYPKSQSRVLTGQHNPITHACCMHSTANGKRFITAEALRKAININFPDITFQEPYRIVAVLFPETSLQVKQKDDGTAFYQKKNIASERVATKHFLQAVPKIYLSPRPDPAGLAREDVLHLLNEEDVPIVEGVDKHGNSIKVCTLGNKLFQWNDEQPACSIFVECTAPACSNVVSSDNTGPNKGPASDRQPQHARCRRQQCQSA